ncbi:hypothetical protein LguiB_012542 [Lonicera macranthoides]
MGKSTASSSSPILPEEIIFQILKELPVKTLVRFRAVSKLWCSIIDDPFFVDSHRTRSHTRNGGISILCQYRENFSFKIYTTDPQGGSSVPFLTLPDGILGDDDDDYLDIDSYSFNRLQSVNGLVCRNNCIWNPSTRQSIDLPPISIEANGDRWMVFPNNLLGFDSVTKQYKVFHICHSFFRQLERVEFRILTLGRDLNWRNLDSVPEKLGLRTGFGVCCVDDVIFCSGSADSNEVIVAFEVGSEKFKVIPLPIGAESANAILWLHVSDYLTNDIQDGNGYHAGRVLWNSPDYMPNIGVKNSVEWIFFGVISTFLLLCLHLRDFLKNDDMQDGNGGDAGWVLG